MDDWAYWLMFFSAALALNLSPGPDLLFILSRTLAHDTRVGLASAAGVCSGALVHVLAATLGLSALLASSSTAFNAVKYLGAAYLLYLGVQTLCSAGQHFTPRAALDTPRGAWRAYREGILVDVLNPKVAIFFMAFLPPFIRPEQGSATLQLLTLGLLVIAVAMLVEGSFVLLAGRASAFFRQQPRVAAWLDRLLGTVLLGLAARLALSEPAP
ncbi:LysE family translocator [Atopomonas sediminilitoris]|uniref:LysE family translocator n=1 Tax=Atopomonas sediminilitoris TaxID=2919919 RepID=UPI001F4E6118|nr:LysE family translocator [Atopomonas sediminilitoris]MCJ8168188.1 LysE family translocator [Atopomonas sediminilitoris]